MADRYIKHVPSSQVFVYAEPWIGRDDFVECANPAGDPIPDPAAIVNPAPKPRAKKATDPSPGDEALAADASRGLTAQGL